MTRVLFQSKLKKPVPMQLHLSQNNIAAFCVFTAVADFAATNVISDDSFLASNALNSVFKGEQDSTVLFSTSFGFFPWMSEQNVKCTFAIEPRLQVAGQYGYPKTINEN